MELEYDEITKDRVKEIFIEETGKEPPSTINIYKSADIIDESEANGFKGTIIHFYDEIGINQTYTITRGSELTEDNSWRSEDWLYNIMGIFVGRNSNQYIAAINFDEKVTELILNKKEVSYNIDLKKFGLGHSLGGNLNTLIQLTTERYDSTYTTNPAPPTFYQLYSIDDDFAEELNEKFSINPFDLTAIYDIDPKSLKEFTEDYYKDSGKNIHHTITEQDFLHAVASNVRGFINVGETTKIDAFPNKEVESINKLIAALPDEVVRDIQVYLAKNYSGAYNEGGFDGFIQELTGIDGAFIDDLIEYEGWDYVQNLPGLVSDFSAMARDIRDKLPQVINYVQMLYTQLPGILDTLHDLNYITIEEKNLITTELEGLEQDLLSIFDTADAFLSLPTAVQIFQIRSVITDIKGDFSSSRSRIDVILGETSELQSIFNSAVDAHGLGSVIGALGIMENKRYTAGGDLIFSAIVDGEEIDVNVSSATRIYTKGMSLIEEKQTLLNQLKQHYEMEYLQDFELRKKNLMEQIDDMESRPYAYQHLLGNFTYDTKQFYHLRKIYVHDYIEPLPNNGFRAPFENMFTYMESDIEKTTATLTAIRNTIEQLFEEEKEIANTIF
ncbi:DUF6792 domain-containing protein [Virgibacillus sp. YIM 98842]|uniref:DUF6792 domain-containing protein n=1 Tax=Virgibacillus sp. YIM 98842 TaxID=2663533 RepID=UPI0013DD7963|nr:DUF6792 domain-containing protein [Virgibacillus sp. YIM 98842]